MKAARRRQWTKRGADHLREDQAWSERHGSEQQMSATCFAAPSFFCLRNRCSRAATLRCATSRNDACVSGCAARRVASLGDVSPTVEESVLRTGLADPTPSDAFPCCAARRVARMVHFSNPALPSRLNDLRASAQDERRRPGAAVTANNEGGATASVDKTRSRPPPRRPNLV